MEEAGVVPKELPAIRSVYPEYSISLRSPEAELKVHVFLNVDAAKHFLYRLDVQDFSLEHAYCNQERTLL